MFKNAIIILSSLLFLVGCHHNEPPQNQPNPPETLKNRFENIQKDVSKTKDLASDSKNQLDQGLNSLNDLDKAKDHLKNSSFSLNLVVSNLEAIIKDLENLKKDDIKESGEYKKIINDLNKKNGDILEQNKKLKEDVNKELNKKLTWFILFSTIGLGVGVALFFMSGSLFPKIGVTVGIIAGVVLVVSIVLSFVSHILWILEYGVMALVAIGLIYLVYKIISTVKEKNKAKEANVELVKSMEVTKDSIKNTDPSIWTKARNKINLFQSEETKEIVKNIKEEINMKVEVEDSNQKLPDPIV